MKLLWLIPLLLVFLQIEESPKHHLVYNHVVYGAYDGVDPYDDVNLTGMIVPHHIIPLDKLTKMYATASDEAVTHVLLLSPDHFTTSQRPVLTSQLDWEGVFGEVKTNDEFYQTLIKLPFVYKDDREIFVEHGLTTHLPLIKKYFKNAEINVLAVSKQVTKQALDNLLNKIPEGTFVIASVDFSHYYNLYEADKFDLETLKLFEIGNYEAFFGKSDAYFDTPGVLYTVFRFAKQSGYQFKVFDHTNSAHYFNQNIQESTSYYFIGFY